MWLFIWLDLSFQSPSRRSGFNADTFMKLIALFKCFGDLLIAFSICYDGTGIAPGVGSVSIVYAIVFVY